MNSGYKFLCALLLVLTLGIVDNAFGRTHNTGDNTMQVIRGEFSVAMEPHNDGVFDAGRMSLNKAYSGKLSATGKGQMLSYRSAVKGSAGYVAIEQITGSLDGKEGSFVVQHNGLMNGGEQSLSVVIIPDSGTQELSGISGTMEIEILDGKHFYTLNYTL